MSSTDKPMDGKISMVTGATSGIGKVTALELARQGSTVIVVGRNSEKSIATVDYIKEKTGNSSVEFILADLSVQSDVRHLSEVFLSKHQRLDVLVNNAGVSMQKRQVTADGLEATFAVNHLSHFLLTNLLLDTVKRSHPVRIINVSSAMHTIAKMDFDNLQGEKKFGGMTAYAQSKLANILFTYELSRRLTGSDVTVNAMHPGLVKTNFSANTKGVAGLIWRFITLFAISPEKGAQTVVYLATSPEVQQVTGKYFVKKKEVKSSTVSYDQSVAKQLWQVSAKLTGLPTSI